MVLRVATYNVHKCKGMDWRVSPARIADVIGNLQADFVATHEVLYSQAEDISRRIGTPFLFGDARRHAGEPYGNAVFTKLRVVSSENYDLTVHGRERRQCLRASVAFPNCETVNFFALHLGTSYQERRQQARQFVSDNILASPHFSTHRLVAGDLNEWTRGLATTLLSRELQTQARGRSTYPGIAPFLPLDQIYYDRDFELREMQLYRTRLSLIASDHLPLVATFSVAG